MTSQTWPRARVGVSRIRVRGEGVGRRAARAITDRRDRDDRAILETVRAEADDAARARPVLLSLLSHDLRNPLSVILVSLRMLGRAVGEGDPSRRHVDAITRASDEIQGILQDMSDAARIEEGRLTLTMTREDVAAMLAHAAEAARRAAGAKDVSIDVGSADDAGAVLCDRDRIQKLLAGLVANAVRVTPRGSSITVRAERDGDGAARIAVSDKGHGIPEDLQDRVFELPVAPSSNHARLPGTTLSLYAARGVVEAHGGSIVIEPAPGGGTTFVVTLPEDDAQGGEG